MILSLQYSIVPQYAKILMKGINLSRLWSLFLTLLPSLRSAQNLEIVETQIF